MMRFAYILILLLAASASASFQALEKSDGNFPSIGNNSSRLWKSGVAARPSFSMDAQGRVTAITNATVTFGYNEMNQLTNSSISVNSCQFVIQNFYDLNGNRTNIVYPGGLTVSYEFGADNRLESVTTKYTNDTKTVSFGYE